MRRSQLVPTVIAVAVLLLTASLAFAQAETTPQAATEPSGLEILVFIVVTGVILAAAGGLFFLSRSDDKQPH